MVTDTQTRYRKATLRAQVLDRLATITPGTPAASATPSPGDQGKQGNGKQGNGNGNQRRSAHGSPGNPQPSATRAPVEVMPSSSLVGCVMHLTRDVRPEFVDRATYQSKPAYVFAVADEIWVVGLACTATSPALITAMSLGNVT
jgi:hypothetical protein